MDRLGKNDALIVAGDISHKFERLEKTLNMLTSELECPVFFVPRNHEAWLDTPKKTTCQNTLEKVRIYPSFLSIVTECIHKSCITRKRPFKSCLDLSHSILV